MSITHSQLKKFTIKSVEHLQVRFLYPKLVIFEDTQNFHIVDLQVKKSEEICEDHKLSFKLDQDILDTTLQDNFLWLILRSGQLLVTDVLKGSQLKIKLNNYENYKIHKFQTIDHLLLLISERGECLSAPFRTQELLAKLDEGATDVTVNLERAHKHYTSLKSCIPKRLINGLEIYSEGSNIVMTCPETSINEVITTNVAIKHIVPWDDVIFLAGKSNMWIADLREANIVYEFTNVEANYYPLAAHDNGFYYLVWDKTEVQICCAWRTSALSEEHQGSQFSNECTTKLSSQETLKTRMQSLVEAALMATEPGQLIQQLKTYFENITDFTFLIENASKLCQHDIAYKSILYPLQTRVFTSSDNELINLIGDLMIKIDLLEYILFKGINTYDINRLFEQNLIQLCVTFISKSDLDLATICWLKYSETKSIMVPDDVTNILNAVPYNIKMGTLIIWLRNFVPPLLDENPYYIDLFVRWTTQRVFLLEQSSYWPKIGLKFLDEIVTVLQTSLKTITIHPISIDDLGMLKDHINYIMELKEKYKINMLLGEISSQSPSEVALIMLRRCYTEDLAAFLQDYLPPFATRYLFEMDDTLRSFIETEAASCGGSIDSARLKIILEAFRTPTSKLDCLLQVLKVLDVPWDDTILDLAKAGAASVFKDFTVTDADRILAQDIQKELNYAKVKVILKKYNFPLTCTDYMLVLHKLINATTVNLNDLKVITGVMSSYTHYGSVLYIDRCLGDCETKVALNYFNDLSNKEKKILLNTITTKYEEIINGNTNDTIMERNYLDFLKGTGFLNEIQTNSIENLYHLKNSYNIVLDMNNIYNEKSCANARTEWIRSDGVTVSSSRGRCVTQLTGTHQSRSSMLVALIRRASTSNQVRKLVEILITSNPDEESAHTENTTSVLSQFKDGQNSSLLLDSFNVLIELVTSCVEEHLRYLIGHLSVLNALINSNIVVKNLSVAWKFHYIFLPMSSVTATNDLIDFYNKTSSNTDANAVSGNSLYNSDFMAFRKLANELESSVISGKAANIDFIEVKENAGKRLLMKVIASQELDEVLLTSLLLILTGIDDNEDKSWILDILQGQNESIPPAIMCYLSSFQIRRTLSLDNFLPGNAVSYSYPPQYILKSKFNINLGEIALPDSSEETWDVKVVLFYVLRQYPKTSFERLVEYCRTLSVSLNDGLSLQLISLLTTWELKYRVFTDYLGCRQLYIENSAEDVTSKCSTIWENIEDKSFLKDILVDFWKNGEVTLHGRQISINPYYYEVYVCIYYLIYSSTVESRNKKDYFLLNFLKEYKRKSTPKQYEFELFSVKGMFPEIGHYRLPFHLFMRDDMWSNLKSEITLETYERWLPAVAMLALDAEYQTARDMICSNALKQTMTSRKRNENTEEDSKENEPWRLTTREEPLLRAAHRCVRHISNMEWAGACLFYVLQGCARGADQVAAAQLCYQFAQRWAALQPGNRAVRQMERLHSSLSTRHALHKIEWACEEFVRLASEPAQLIRALYLHPNFVERMSRYDVNRAATEIADKNGINISSIRIQILEDILTKSNDEKKNTSFCGLDTKRLMTAKFILKATCPKMGAIYLSRIAFNDDSDFNKCKKLRALQCFMSVVDPDTAMKVANRERDALWSSLLELLHTINLEYIDMPWVIATFMQDKTSALEQLLQAVGGNIEGLKISADLARRFGNAQIIRKLIPMLLRASLYEELIPLLLKVSSPPDTLIYTAWRAVILSPFQRADYPITERQKAKCLNAINLLPVCPAIKDEDLLEIWKHCMRCKCFGLGCLVLPYITPETRESVVELKKIDRRNLIACLKNLQSDTYLVSGAMHVLESMSSRYR